MTALRRLFDERRFQLDGEIVGLPPAAKQPAINCADVGTPLYGMRSSVRRCGPEPRPSGSAGGRPLPDRRGSANVASGAVRGVAASRGSTDAGSVETCRRPGRRFGFILPAVENGTFHMILHSAVSEIIRLTPSLRRGRGQVGNLVLEAPDCGETRVFTMHASPHPALAASQKGEPDAIRPRRRLGVKRPKCNRERNSMESVNLNRAQYSSQSRSHRRRVGGDPRESAIENRRGRKNAILARPDLLSSSLQPRLFGRLSLADPAPVKAMISSHRETLRG